MLPARIHLPGEEKLVTFFFGEKLRAGDQLIGTATITVDAGLTVRRTQSDLEHALVSAIIVGGVDGEDYTVFAQHDTSDGEVLILGAVIECRRLDV